MNLCSHSHDEIYHDQRMCPICQQIADLNQDIERLQDELADTQLELDEAVKELLQMAG